MIKKPSYSKLYESNEKNLLIKKSDFIIIFPGSYGTLDELFEVLTLNQLKITNKPVFILNTNNYWSPLRNLLLNAYKEGFILKKIIIILNGQSI